MKYERFINVQDKLNELEIPVENISLGEFDYIGEATAKKMRNPGTELWKKAGAFFKPNLERGLLISSLITKYKLSSYMEIGFGRGYSAICAARAFHELGNDGTVMVIEPNVDDAHMQVLSQAFPKEWMQRIHVAKAPSADILPKLKDKYDFVFVDGDHTKDAVISDWQGIKELFTCFCMFDDYHVNGAEDQAIKVKEALDTVELPTDLRCELIRTDRRMFIDDRRWSDERVDYGELLLTRQSEVDQRGKELKFAETWDW